MSGEVHLPHLPSKSGRVSSYLPICNFSIILAVLDLLGGGGGVHRGVDPWCLKFILLLNV